MPHQCGIHNWCQSTTHMCWIVYQLHKSSSWQAKIHTHTHTHTHAHWCRWKFCYSVTCKRYACTLSWLPRLHECAHQSIHTTTSEAPHKQIQILTHTHTHAHARALKQVEVCVIGYARTLDWHGYKNVLMNLSIPQVKQLQHRIGYINLFDDVMAGAWMNVTHMHEWHHTYVRIISRKWTSHITHMNESVTP